MYECAVCGAKDAKPYTFFYGKPTGVSGGGAMTTTTYIVAGSRRVFVCNRCVLKEWLRKAGKVLLLGTVTVSVNAAANYAQGSKVVGTILALVAVSAGGFAVLALLHLVLSGRRNTGIDIAIRLQKEDLHRAGYGTVWRRNPRRKKS